MMNDKPWEDPKSASNEAVLWRRAEREVENMTELNRRQQEEIHRLEGILNNIRELCSESDYELEWPDNERNDT